MIQLMCVIKLLLKKFDKVVFHGSIFVVVVCILALAGMTWHWFTLFPTHAEFSSDPDPAWTTNGEVDAMATIDDTVYIGGYVTFVEPYTSPRVPIDTSTSQPVSTY